MYLIKSHIIIPPIGPWGIPFGLMLAEEPNYRKNILFYLWYIHILDANICNWFRLVQYTLGGNSGPRNTKTKLSEIRKFTGKVTGPGSTNPNVHPVRRPFLTLHSHREYKFTIAWTQCLWERSNLRIRKQRDRQTENLQYRTRTTIILKIKFKCIIFFSGKLYY